VLVCLLSNEKLFMSIFRRIKLVCVKFYSKGQMSGKKWEDALSSNCTLQDEHLEREVFPWILYQ